MIFKIFDLEQDVLVTTIQPEINLKDINLGSWLRINLKKMIYDHCIATGHEIDLNGIEAIYLADDQLDTHPEIDVYTSFDLKSSLAAFTISSVKLEVKNDSKYRIVAYEPGLKIRMGYGQDIFGGLHLSFLSKITSRKIVSSNFNEAKVFKKWSDLNKFLDKYSYVLTKINKPFILDDKFAPEAKTKKELEYKQKCINYFNLMLNGTVSNDLDADSVDVMIKHCLNKLGVVHSSYDIDFTNYLQEKVNFNNIIVSNPAMINRNEIEEKYNKFIETYSSCVPYMIVTSESPEIGRMMSILYVSRDSEEWEYAKPYDLKDRSTGLSSYTYNLTYPDCSEFGDIGVLITDNKIKRVW